MPAPELKFSDSKMSIFWWRNVQLMDMPGAISTTHVDEMDRLYKALLKSNPNGVIGLTTVQPDAPPSDSETAKRGGEILKALGTHVKHVSVVILGTGIKGMAIRTLMRTINVLSRSPHPLLVHDTINSAADAVAPAVSATLGTSVTPQEVVTAIQDARNLTAAKG